MTQGQALNDEWIQLGCKQADLYEQNPVAYVSVLVKDGALRNIMARVYVSVLKWKLELPMEQLPEVEKRKLWQAATAEAAGRINQEECIKLAKALYTINCFLNQ